MDTSLPNPPITQSASTVRSALLPPFGSAESHEFLNTGASTQMAKSDEEKLDEWRMRMKQIRAGK